MHKLKYSFISLRTLALSPGHDKELSHHARTFTNVLLHQLRARDADEAAVRVVRHGSSKQRLPRTRWTVQKHTLRADLEVRRDYEARIWNRIGID